MYKRSSLGCLYCKIMAALLLTSCAGKKNNAPTQTTDDMTIIITTDSSNTQTAKGSEAITFNDSFYSTIQPDSIVAFAKTLIGIPYLYASTDPNKGFDCSGFITYVFNHFSTAVPRSSVDFTNYGKEITIEEAKPGDLILFTGTDSTIRIVGHMGIVENVQEGKLHFIHSTSGHAQGVVITSFEKYYQSRFVKIIRLFPDESFE